MISRTKSRKWFVPSMPRLRLQISGVSSVMTQFGTYLGLIERDKRPMGSCIPKTLFALGRKKVFI